MVGGGPFRAFSGMLCEEWSDDALVGSPYLVYIAQLRSASFISGTCIVVDTEIEDLQWPIPNILGSSFVRSFRFL